MNALSNLRGRGRPLDFERDRVVLLFFEDFGRDRRVRGDRHAIRVARKLVKGLRGKQRVTGFGVAFASLVTSLELAGYEVRVGDYRLARANPTYPVGMAGYPHILDRWDLPNPTVLGPGLLDHPSLNPGLMNRPAFVRYIVPCGWMADLFGKTFPKEKLGLFFAGIDLDEWHQARAPSVDLDFLVYDKIRWDHGLRERELVAPIINALEKRGLTYQRLRYGKYDHATYQSLLARSRAMLFICEHETQGLAYQEAMASNVPVLAWDPGLWLDPNRFDFGEQDVPASSVPYFDETCGNTFKDFSGFDDALSRFVSRRPQLEPRRFVAQHLSMKASAEAYLTLYRAAGAVGTSHSGTR